VAEAQILPRVIVETPGELLLQMLKAGNVSTNVYLRRLHNFSVDTGCHGRSSRNANGPP